MAAYKDSSGSAEDNLCSPCLEGEVSNKATMFCVECGIYYCDGCLVYHNKFPSTRKHRTVHQTDVVHESGSMEVVEYSDKCRIHPGQVLTKFCHDHDEVCCPGCIAIKHRSCDTVESLKEAAKGMSNSTECEEYKDALKNTFTLIQVEQQKRRDNMSSLEEERAETVAKIEERGDKLIDLIKERTKESKNEIEGKHSECIKASEGEYNELETLQSVYDGMSRNIEATNLSDIELFIRLKHDKYTFKNLEKTVSGISNKWQPQKIGYVIDEVVDGECVCLKTFGAFLNENTKYHVENKREIDVKLQNDKQNCDINSICKQEDGTYFLSDYLNKNVKKMNADYKVVGRIGVGGSPVAICVTGNKEIAVALRDMRKVQFISCGQPLALSSSFSTDRTCTGLYFDSQNKELYVSCGVEWLGDTRATVDVYLKDGTRRRSYENDESGSRLFRSPIGLTRALNTGTLYIADRKNGVIALGKNGTLRWVYHNKKLKEPWGVCLLPDNQLLVTDYDSGKVLQIGTDGKEVEEIIAASELKNPYTVLNDMERSTLMIGCNSNKIYIYNLDRYSP